MTIYQWLGFFGVDALLAALGAYIFKRLKKNREDYNALKMGMQALLRAQMISDYNKWEERGYAPIYARDNFENCWAQYHALGANGVMNGIHEKFMRLPTEPHNKAKGAQHERR